MLVRCLQLSEKTPNCPKCFLFYIQYYRLNIEEILVWAFEVVLGKIFVVVVVVVRKTFINNEMKAKRKKYNLKFYQNRKNLLNAEQV